MNSKNMSAAEKHFEKKELKLKRDVRDAQWNAKALEDERVALIKIATEAFEEVERVTKLNERLEELMALSKTDRELLLTHLKKMNKIDGTVKLIKGLNLGMGGFGMPDLFDTILASGAFENRTFREGL